MRFVVQRVSEARVEVDGTTVAKIRRGLVVLVGIHRKDTVADAEKWVEKILKLRIFPDDTKDINCSIRDIDGEILWVSQFTLYGDTRGQNRPGFTEAASPESARRIYDRLIHFASERWPKSQSGQFAAHMHLHLVNDGPVTLILE